MTRITIIASKIADVVGELPRVRRAAGRAEMPGSCASSSPARRLRHANAQPCFKPPTTDGSAAGRTT